MAKLVVVLLEVIDVGHQDGEFSAGRVRPHPLLNQALNEEAVICQTGQPVGVGLVKQPVPVQRPHRPERPDWV